MRRQTQYADSGYAASASLQQPHHMPGLKPSSGFEAFTPERDTNNTNNNPYAANSKPEGQWRWERDPGSKGSNPIAPHMFNEGQVGDASRSYFQGQRSDPKLATEIQTSSDPQSQPHNEDIDLRYEDPQSFENLEQKFLDEIRKLAKEQDDAEDAENARHREKLGAINAQYEEQLASLRHRYAGRRDELLRRESNARQHQYQQSMMDRYPNSKLGPSDLHGYSGVAGSATVGEARRAYDTDQYDSYRERDRFLGGSHDHGFDPRGPYPGGRVYDTSSRYY